MSETTLDCNGNKTIGRDAEISEPEEELVLNKAPDGGWGWVVVLGSFMIHVIADGIAYSFGIYVESFLVHFNASRSEVGFLGSLMLGVTWGTGPIASMLTNKYGCRAVAIAGAIVAAAGLIISIFAPNIYFMYFSFGIVTGFGLGMAYLPAIVAVSFYFEKRRSLATGLAVCGSGVGTFIFAPITQMLLDEYGWKGTVLIEAGILLNCVWCGAVFRPLPVSTSAVNQNNGDPEQGSEKFVSNRKNVLQVETGKANGAKVSEIKKDLLKPFVSSTRSLAMRKQEPISVNSYKILSSSETHLAKDVNSGSRLRITHATSSACNVSQGPMARKDIFYTASLRNIPLFNADEAEYRRSMINIQPATDTDAEESGCRLLQMLGCSRKMINALKDTMDCRLMISIVFQLFAISNLLTSIGLCVPYVFLPNRAAAMGMDESEGAFLISIVGISNTVGRIVFGFLADFKCINRLMLYNTVLVLCGACSLLSALCFNYPLMATYSASFGLFIGVYICLTPIVLVDLLGLENLSNSFGLVLLYQGIGAVIGPPMAGAIYDETKDYNNSFYLMGVCVIVSGAMLYPIPCIQRFQSRNVKRSLSPEPSSTTTATSA